MIRTVDILLIEDNPGDVRLMQEAFKVSTLQNTLHVVSDGVEAMMWLRRQGRYAEAVGPDLILLDLNLPKKDGREVLKEIKEDERLKRIPTVVLTTSQAQRDILKAYTLHANCYITKPVNLEEFFNVVKAIEEFWLGVVTLPHEGHDG